MDMQLGNIALLQLYSGVLELWALSLHPTVQGFDDFDVTSIEFALAGALVVVQRDSK